MGHKLKDRQGVLARDLTHLHSFDGHNASLTI